MTKNQLNFYSNRIKTQLGRTLVTGGAGFIGSHVVEELISNKVDVNVLDNLTTGKLANLNEVKGFKNFHFIRGNINSSKSLSKAMKETKTIFHLAANPEVRIGFQKPEISYNDFKSTYFLLEAIRKSNVEKIVFTSTSTIYGEPKTIPTPEDYGPLFPISIYGSSKLACEALIFSYCHQYGIKGLILRLANVVGSRSNHGVIYDFIEKLKRNKKTLKVLGDGKQSKSYLHVSDFVGSMFYCLHKNKKNIDVFNVGNKDRINVIKIAKLVCDCMNLKNVKIQTSGGTKDGRGWRGDVKFMHLDIGKLKKIGWKPEFSSFSAIQKATNELLLD